MISQRILLTSILSCVALGQSASHVSIDPGSRNLSATAAEAELDQIIGQLNMAKLRPLIADSWEDQVVQAAKKGATASLRIKIADLSGPTFYTLQSAQGDVLVAHWSGSDSARPEKAIWLWDTPFETMFLTEVEQSLLKRETFVPHLEGLFRWQDFAKLRSITLIYPPAGSATTVIAGILDHERQERGAWRIRLLAKSQGTVGYVAVGITKAMLSYPVEADGVPERFPPLRARIKTSTWEALLGEVGRGYVPKQLLTYPTNRDAIVIREIIGRGPLKTGELRSVLVGGFGDGDSFSALVLNCRMTAFLRAARDAKVLADYGSALKDIFLSLNIHSTGDFVLGQWFNAMHQEGIDISPVALELLSHEKFINLSLFELRMYGRDRATLLKLAETAVPPQFEQKKKQALSDIENRLKGAR